MNSRSSKLAAPAASAASSRSTRRLAMALISAKSPASLGWMKTVLMVVLEVHPGHVECLESDRLAATRALRLRHHSHCKLGLCEL